MEGRFVGKDVLEAGRFVAGRFVAGRFVEGGFVELPSPFGNREGESSNRSVQRAGPNW